MRIRFPFLIAFIILLLFSSSLGLLPHSALPTAPGAEYAPKHSDKALHFIAFFALTATFYFILDTARRRVLHLTLVVCTLVLSVGSEVAQGLLPNDREFDAWDVLANVLGSLSALGLATWYHKRATERRRRAKFSALGQLGGEDGDVDVELGDGPGLGGATAADSTTTTDELGRDPRQQLQESGTIAVGATGPTATKTVEDELDNWDENVPDEVWDGDDDDDDGAAAGKAAKLTPATSSVGSEETPAGAAAMTTTAATTAQVDKLSVD